MDRRPACNDARSPPRKRGRTDSGGQGQPCATEEVVTLDVPDSPARDIGESAGSNSVAQRKFDFSSLPDGALLSIFDLLAPPLVDEPWSRRRCFGFIFRSAGAPAPKPEYWAVVSGTKPYLNADTDAFKLAATSRRLAEVFRTACVSTIVVNPQNRLLDDEMELFVPSGDVAAAVARFPAADSVVFNHEGRFLRFGMNIREVVGKPLPGIIRVVLRRVTFRVKNVDDLLYAFPDLSELVLLKCTVTDTDLVLLCWRFGSALKKLRLLGTKQAPTGFFSDAGAIALNELKELRVLCLDRQMKLTSQAFQKIAALSLLETLNVDCTEFDDVSARALSGLGKLLNLSVAGCRNLTYAMLEFLPPNLESVNLSQTSVLCPHTPVTAFSESPPVKSYSLVTLQADQILLEDWKPLGNAPSLRQVYMRKCNIPSINAREVFATWTGLRRLDISGCSRFTGRDLVAWPSDVVADAAIEAIAYLLTRVKELRIDTIGLTCFHWVCIIAKVQGSGLSTQNLTLLTLSRPSLNRESFVQHDYGSRKIAEAVPTLLKSTFRRAELRMKVPLPMMR